MSLELTTLRLLKYRDRHERLSKAVPVAALEAVTQTILADFGRFFREFPEVQVIKHETFYPWFKAFAHPTLKAESYAVFDALLRKVDDDVTPDVEAGLMARLVAADTAHRMTELLGRWQEGDELDLYVEMRSLVEHYETQTNRKVKTPLVRDSIESLLEDEKNDRGLHWRLSCLNMSMRPLRGGDFVIVAGRPDKGKTSFLTDQLTYMAAQMEDLYPGEGRHVLWFNNEGPGKRIKQRAYQSALNATVPELVEMSGLPSTNGKKNLLRERYDDVMAGRWDILEVLDVHDYWSHEVEDILRAVPVGLAVFDMIDNIKFGGGGTNNGERTDQLLEAMYQWARVCAVKYDIPIIATSQISADGDGLQYPTLSMLKDSKTGKQGAAEAIITLGASNDPNLQRSRFIGMTKNKLHRSGGPKDPRCEVIFDSERGRYLMPV